MEDENIEDSPIVVQPNGVPEPIALVTVLVLMAAIAGLIFLANHDPRPCDNTAEATAQAATAKAQSDMQIRVQERLVKIQEQVLDSCVNHGRVPILTNGNIDCKTQ